MFYFTTYPRLIKSEMCDYKPSYEHLVTPKAYVVFTRISHIYLIFGTPITVFCSLAYTNIVIDL